MSGRTCSVDGCEAPHNSRGWCRKHYTRWQRYGQVGDEILKWAPKDSACSYCGEAVAPGGRYRRWCSISCAEMDRSQRPRSRPCAVCGVEFSLLARNARTGRRVKSQRTSCDDCRKKPNHLTDLIPRLVERDGNRCGICRRSVDLSLRYPDPRSGSVDHIVPRCRGGADDLTNYQLACLECNVKKRDRVDYQPDHLTAATAATQQGE